MSALVSWYVSGFYPNLINKPGSFIQRIKCFNFHRTLNLYIGDHNLGEFWRYQGFKHREKEGIYLVITHIGTSTTYNWRRKNTGVLGRGKKNVIWIWLINFFFKLGRCSICIIPLFHRKENVMQEPNLGSEKKLGLDFAN